MFKIINRRSPEMVVSISGQTIGGEITAEEIEGREILKIYATGGKRGGEKTLIAELSKVGGILEVSR